MTGKIYIIKNTENQKIYIGKTFDSIQTRFNTHKRDSKKVKNQHRHFYKAINKYGVDKFYIELLEDNIKEEELSNKEIEYILKLDSYNNGYNSTLGGDGSRYINIPDSEIIEKYKELKYIKKVAEYYSICIDTVRLIIRNNNVPILIQNNRKVKILELNKNFSSLASCCKFLIDNKYTQCKNIRNIGTNIYRSIKRNSKYINFTFIIE